ncbi:MAG: zinc-binding dehydrogenase [Chloroflexi bacterium]|nr:zinc-binding dehydrogenase [Chloroflexota bacterium]
MLSVIFCGNSRVETREVPDPRPAPGEVLLRVRASALCGSELKAYRAPEGRPLNGGHEIAGEVVAVNHTSLRAPGDRVAVDVMVGCGRCHHCLSGDPKYCPELNLKIGGHSQYVTVAASACLLLPDDVAFDTGVLLGGDFVGTSYRAIKRLGLTATDTALVIGAGPVGLGAVSLLRFLGLRVLVTEPSAYRRDLVARLGAVVLDPHAVDVIGVTADLTAGLGPDVAIDCAGRPETQNLALDAVRVKGKVGFVGENSALTINPSKQIIHKELTVVGSWYFTSADYHEILALYRRGYRVDHLITHRFPIEQADLAYRTFAAGETGKVLISLW